MGRLVIVILLLGFACVQCHLTTDVLWESCETKLCGPIRLDIHCETNTKILINKVSSGLGKMFDLQSYQNLRRMCMGMVMCDTKRFCDQHGNFKIPIFRMHCSFEKSLLVLWESCETKLCGPIRLDIHCETNTKILINKVSSGLGKMFDLQSYQNLRRMCMGMVMCDTKRFCDQHQSAPYFNVSYTCVAETDIDTSCEEHGQQLKKDKGFIISPNYPAEVSNYRRCSWNIHVPPKHYVHIFLHDIQSTTPDTCDGLIFNARATCDMAFPTFAVCDDSRMNSTISACSTTKILLSLANQSMRFWLSYYVLPVSQLAYASLYDVDITCVVHGKPKFAYSQAYYDRNKTATNITDTNRGQVAVGKSSGEDDDTGMYVGIAVAIILCIVIIVIVIVFVLRRRRAVQQSKMKGSESLSNSNSQNEIQKRPLPEAQYSGDPKDDSGPKLQLDYSVVADEVPRVPWTPTSPTYAEIEEYSDNTLNPKATLVQKKSIDSSVRELPAKPKEEPHSSVYVDLDDAEAKDVETEKGANVLAKNRKNEETYQPSYIYKKKMSIASNIYAECADVTNDKDVKKDEKGKSKSSSDYMDMSRKPYANESYVTRSKNNKDRVNISKRFQATTQGNTDADKSKAAAAASKAKKDSVTSESDSDDDICIVENDVYEPFESAKV